MSGAITTNRPDNALFFPCYSLPFPCYCKFSSLLSEIRKTHKTPENAALYDCNGIWTAIFSVFSLYFSLLLAKMTRRLVLAALRPHAFGERKRMIKEGIRLAHYAAAETATKILTNQEFWLRDSRCMNDFQEVHHGLRLLEGFFADSVRKAAFLDAVNSIHLGVGEEVVGKFYDWKSRL